MIIILMMLDDFNQRNKKMKDYPKEELLNYFQKNKTYFPGMFNNVLKKFITW